MERTKRGPLIESAEKQRKRPSNFAQAEKGPGSPEKDHADSERRLQSVIRARRFPRSSSGGTTGFFTGTGRWRS